MSFIPVRMPSELFVYPELQQWKVSRQLHGVIAEDLEDLLDRFPEGENFKEGYIYGPPEKKRAEELNCFIYVRPLFKEETQQLVREHKVAYECPSCNHIILGPPRIIPRWSGGLGMQVVRDEVDMEYFCRSCEAQLHMVRYDSGGSSHHP